jgi:rRNA-processing protein EBP2
MGKNKNNKKMKEPVLPDSDEEMEYQVESDNDDDDDDRLTLSKLDEISDGEEEDIEEWDAEAKALRQAIADGAFAKLNLKKISPAAAAAITGDAMEEGDDDVEDDNDDDDDEDDDESDQDTENESSSDGEDEENAKKVKTQNNSIKALKSITAQLVHQKARLPWPEKFDVVPPNPLPFGQVSEDGLVIDVHDDLKREVAFYNLALEAVYEARQKCEDCNIPFSRPDDFFAEMVKTDDHMAKVKDRLIFETKKIEAFEQRKSNREQKLRQKEAHAHRLAEKSKAKKQHLQDVQDWAKSAASNRVGGGKVRDDDDDYLNRMNSGPSKKRQNFDKKYGFGGKRGRFKQNSSKDLNDMSGFKPKGSFAGGMKATANKRKGKRARDAAKSRK